MGKKLNKDLEDDTLIKWEDLIRNKNKKVLCLIQARLNSKRFPKKMLTKINGIEILKWVFLRLKRNKNIRIVSSYFKQRGK